MIHFFYPPDNSSYNVTDAAETLSVQLDGGAPKMRKDMIGGYSDASVVWICGPEQYKYVRSFYKAVTQSGALPFTIDLIIDETTLTTHTVYFVPGSIRLDSQRGLSYTVSALLKVQPLPVAESDYDYVIMINEFGLNWMMYTDILDQLINFDLPEAMNE